MELGHQYLGFCFQVGGLDQPPGVLFLTKTLPYCRIVRVSQ